MNDVADDGDVFMRVQTWGSDQNSMKLVSETRANEHMYGFRIEDIGGTDELTRTGSRWKPGTVRTDSRTPEKGTSES